MVRWGPKATPLSAAVTFASIGVPPTIEALLSARLDRLLPDERAVVERASVVGRTFDEASVVALCSPDAAIRRAEEP